jgi:tetratricopeptide (TPR) repeat protein
LAEVEEHLLRKRYKRAAQAARRIIDRVPAGSQPYGEACYQLGSALGMLQDFEGSYEALSKALQVDPRNAVALHNRALSAQFLSLTVQALRDLEQAVKLARNPENRETFRTTLASTREIVQKQLMVRGPDFTRDQLAEQQELFHHGLDLMTEERWAEAGEAFRRVIDMADVAPQPWGNLGGCLVMQEQYHEAEEAFKRALEIEPDYDLARENLALLSSGLGRRPAGIRLRKAHEGLDIQMGAVIVEE